MAAIFIFLVSELERVAIHTLCLCRIRLVRSDVYLGKRAVIGAVTVVSALLNCTSDALVCIVAIHISLPPLSTNIFSMRHF